MQATRERGRWAAGGRWVCAALVAVALIGCGGKKDFLKTYPAKGTVTFRGKPMQYARITLYTTAGDADLKKVLPRAQAQADGTFVLGTYKYSDGAPPGEYNVVITWPNGPEEKSESPGYVADQLKGRYADAAKSGITVTITEGDNALEPIDLK
ncbi:MAG: carboxypeptidase regulatory-like domain-containing protein [Pirellulales bacterium]|nr:carboxypeptidase regulatory-like domain-containing protein [Pirellulales bacterium]